MLLGADFLQSYIARQSLNQQALPLTQSTLKNLQPAIHVSSTLQVSFVLSMAVVASVMLLEACHQQTLDPA